MKVTIDGQTIEVEPGTTVLQAARMIGGSCVPPTMCYYAKLKNTGGKCRCCLVEISKGSDRDPRPMPKLQPSCVTAVQDGMEVKSATSERAVSARKAIIEMLLINHPLDCPVCDQAGECDLQNLAYNNKAHRSRFVEEKITFPTEDLGPYIALNKNRCIICYRCVRVGDQLTPERVHGVMYRGDHVEISTYIANSIDNDFSGNMIDVCPVGALTDKTARFDSRIWFYKPFNAHRNCTKCSGKAVVWMFGDHIRKVSARRNKYEVEEYICNECRFDHKTPKDWVIEGPRKFEKYSVINVNNYTRPVEKIKLNMDELVLEGRPEDRKKISMKEFPYDANELEAIKEVNEEEKE